VLTLTASGSLSDYSDTSSLRQGVATAAGVDTSLVTIAVTAGSVLITATIAVPASTTPAAVLTSLASTLGTAAAASTALGITIEEKPAVTIALPPLPPAPSPSPPQPSLSPLPPPPPPLVTTISLRTKDGGGVDLTAAFIGGATAAVTLLVLLLFASRCVPSHPPPALHQPPAFRDLTRCPTAQSPATTNSVIGAEQGIDEGLRPRRRREGIWIGRQLAVDRGEPDPPLQL